MSHLIQGVFQSDKYPETPRGFVPLKLTDKDAQDLLWQYAARHASRDAEFSEDLKSALFHAGYVPPDPSAAQLEGILAVLAALPDGALGIVTITSPPYRVDAIPVMLAGLRQFIQLQYAVEAKSKGKADV